MTRIEIMPLSELDSNSCGYKGGSCGEYMLRRLFSSLDEKTDENYGRFDGLRFNSDLYSKKIVSDSNEIGIIAVGNDKFYLGPPVGYAHLYQSYKPSRAHSAGFGIVVHQDYQGQGVGEALLKEAIKTAKKNKIKKIWLHVYENNKSAINLYHKFGFKQEGRFRKEEYKNGKYIDVLSMARFI